MLLTQIKRIVEEAREVRWVEYRKIWHIPDLCIIPLRWCARCWHHLFPVIYSGASVQKRCFVLPLSPFCVMWNMGTNYISYQRREFDTEEPVVLLEIGKRPTVPHPLPPLPSSYCQYFLTGGPSGVRLPPSYTTSLYPTSSSAIESHRDCHPAANLPSDWKERAQQTERGWYQYQERRHDWLIYSSSYPK